MSCTGDERIHPIKCALRFDPPTFVLFYTNAETGGARRRRRRTIPLRGLTSDTDVASYAQGLLNSNEHGKFFSALQKSKLEALLLKVKTALIEGSTTGSKPVRSKGGGEGLGKGLGKGEIEGELASSGHGSQQLAASSLPPLPTSPHHAPSSFHATADLDSELSKLLGEEEGEEGEEGEGKEEEENRRVAAPKTTPTHASALSLLPSSPPVLQKRRLPPLSSVPAQQTSSSLPNSSKSPKLSPTLPQTTPATASTAATQDSSKTTLSQDGSRTRAVPSQSQDGSRSPTLSLGGSKAAASGGVLLQDNTRTSKSNPSENKEHKLPKTNFPTLSLKEGEKIEHGEKGVGERDDNSLNLSDIVSLSSEEKSVEEGDGIGDPIMPLSGDDYGNEDIVTSEEDLNKVSEEYLREKKEEMEQAFKAHQLLPDNPDYVYDKEEDFREGEVECGWDTDQESDQKF